MDYIQKNLEGFDKEALISHIRWLYSNTEELKRQIGILSYYLEGDGTSVDVVLSPENDLFLPKELKKKL